MTTQERTKQRRRPNRLGRWGMLAVALALGGAVASGCITPRGMYVGALVTDLPHGFVTVHVGGLPYYYYEGLFYRRRPSGFVVVAPPMGAMLTYLPPGHVWLTTGYGPFAYYYGTFYGWDVRTRRYAVVRPPVGVRVPSVPSRARTIRSGGVEYKEYAGTYYRRDRDGRYEVVRRPRPR